MEIYISEFSKYVIALLIALYTYECFAVFRYEEEERRQGIYFRQNFLMFVMHFSCFVVICFEKKDINYLFFYAFAQIILYAVNVLYRMIYPKSNRLVINNMCMLLGIGFIILARLDIGKAIKQLIIVAVSLAVALLIPFFVHKFRFLKSLKWIYALAGIGALSVVMILGQTTYGSKLSYSIGGLTFQPSEFAKVAVILFLAFLVTKNVKKMGNMKTMFLIMVSILPIVGLVGASNLSTAIIILGIGVILVFVASPKYAQFIWMGALGCGFMGIFLALESYRLERLAIWRNPEKFEKGYQTLQGLYAIGSGGLFGRGLGESVQKLGFVPEAQNDMIFSIVCEELGLFGAGFVLILFLILIWRFFVIATHAADLFGALIASGAMAHMMIQVILNIAVVTNTIPNTGITLPFISYGGTSVVFLLLEMGLVLSVSSLVK